MVPPWICTTHVFLAALPSRFNTETEHNLKPSRLLFCISFLHHWGCVWSCGHVGISGCVVMCAGDQVRSEVGEELLLSIPSPLSSRFPAQLSTWSGPHYTDQLVSSFIILCFSRISWNNGQGHTHSHQLCPLLRQKSFASYCLLFMLLALYSWPTLTVWIV